ncbi:phage holin family protein [Candidatus Gracilibacteria bacterium]|nr:phage holin family protein [Candidatus Gracilibacteria bacterium]
MNFIKKIILGILASSLSVYATVYYFPEYLTVEGGLYAFAIIGIIFGILNYFIKPILKIISLPLIFISAGLFTFLINGAVIYMTEYFIKGMPNLGVVFHINGGFLSYIIVAIVLGTINYITHWFVDIK